MEGRREKQNDADSKRIREEDLTWKKEREDAARRQEGLRPNAAPHNERLRQERLQKEQAKRKVPHDRKMLIEKLIRQWEGESDQDYGCGRNTEGYQD
jgi:hypothetical protein